MIAILSDIHGNLEALRAVLDDIRTCGAESIYCLGDIVGYGPEPCACLDLAMDFEMTLLGNHDQAALFDPEGFSPVAEQAVFWTRHQLESQIGPREARERRWEFLSTRPRTHFDAHGMFVHGSARNPLNEYVFPDDIYNQRKMERLFPLVRRSCFQGHTHVPGIFTEQTPGERYDFRSPEELGHIYHLDARKAMCNVGSVGQPRDGDWRACYVLLEGDTIHFRRVEYDVETTVRKIHAEKELDPVLGDRLRKGH
jgi:predicted phosphodiesterase